MLAPLPKRIKICEPSPIHRQPLTKTNQNLRTLAYTHQTTPIHTSNDTLPHTPPKTNQNLRTLTPTLEVRTPIAKAIWGIMICFTVSLAVFKAQHFKTTTGQNMLEKHSDKVLGIRILMHLELAKTACSCSLEKTVW